MIVKFGNYSHRINSAGVSIDRTPILDYKQEMPLATERWDIEFRLINTGTTAKDLDPQIAALEQAYSETQPSVELLHDDLTQTRHVIPAGNTVGGVRVVKPPSYQRFQNGEYVSYRTGNIILEAIIMVNVSSGQLLEYSESLDFEGGGPVFAHLQPNVGLAVKQQVRTNELFTATQSGRTVHFGGYGQIPPPIWPGALVKDPKIRMETPTYVGGVAYGFPTNYTYQFQSATVLLGAPTNPV